MDFFSYFIEYNRYMSLIGMGVVVAIAVLFSHKRSAISLRVVLSALALQVGLGLFILKTPIGERIFSALGYYVDKLYHCADAGINFMFGGLADASGAWGFIFAFKVLPAIIFFGALMALLSYWGVIQFVVGLFNKAIRPLLGTSGAETLCAAGNSFLGQTEAPLLIRHYLKHLTKSEMFVVMVSGMSTLSAVLLAVYAGMGMQAKHLLASSIMSIPCSIMIAKILYPETQKSETQAGASVEYEKSDSNIFSVIFGGTSDGLSLAVNVGAMLIAFLSLLFLLNNCLWFISYVVNSGFDLVNVAWHMPDLSIDGIFCTILKPFGYLLGFGEGDACVAGQLLGKKVALNELLAYVDLASLKATLAPRTFDVLTYALCGFSNFSSIGMQIGGIGALVPEKRQWLAELGLRAVLAGALSNLFTAMIASLML